MPFTWQGGMLVTAARLNSMPRGLIAWARRAGNTTPVTVESGVLRLDNIPVVLGRQYTVCTSPLMMDSTATNDEILCKVRYSTAGVATTSSSLLPGAVVHTRQTDQGVAEDKSISTQFVPGATGTLSLLLTIGRIAGTGSVSLTNNQDPNETHLWVVDTGLAVTNTGVSL